MAASGGVAAAPGQVAFTTPGTHYWTVPAGVYSICAVAVQPGTQPQETYPGATTVTIASTAVCVAENSARVGDGGGNGGGGGTGDGVNYVPGGGGGAGGYSGGGGVGGNASGTAGYGYGQVGSGGGGAGGYYGGGGVGILGQGASGSAAGLGGSGGGSGNSGAGGAYGGGAGAQIVPYTGGQGGALSYKNNISVSPGQTVTISIPATPTGAGPGAARIIWGTGRSFPSTSTGDV